MGWGVSKRPGSKYGVNQLARSMAPLSNHSTLIPGIRIRYDPNQVQFLDANLSRIKKPLNSWELKTHFARSGHAGAAEFAALGLWPSFARRHRGADRGHGQGAAPVAGKKFAGWPSGFPSHCPLKSTCNSGQVFFWWKPVNPYIFLMISL